MEKERLEMCLSPLGFNTHLLNVIITHFEDEWDSLGSY